MKNKKVIITSDGYTSEKIVVNRGKETVEVLFDIGYTSGYKGKVASSLENNQNGLTISLNQFEFNAKEIEPMKIELDYSQADYLYKMLKAYRKYLGGK